MREIPTDRPLDAPLYGTGGGAGWGRTSNFPIEFLSFAGPIGSFSASVHLSYVAAPFFGPCFVPLLCLLI